MNDYEKQQKQIAFVFSVIFPGAGFLYYKKWLKGILYGLVHLFLMGLTFKSIIEIISFRIPLASDKGTLLFILIFAIFLNWIFNIRSTQNYE